MKDMATEIQIEANRINSQASTGPRTAEGKARASKNSTKLGLFTKANCILEGEQPEYDALFEALHDRLRPADAVEEAYAMEIIRATWRLRRCAVAESTHTLRRQSPQQTAVDRARTLAFGILKRATAELRRLQSERWIRGEALPADVDMSTWGIADSRHVSSGISSTVNARVQLGREAEIQARTQIEAEFRAIRQETVPQEFWPACNPQPRNALCKCGSGLKYKRCCGTGVPAPAATPPEAPDQAMAA